MRTWGQTMPPTAKVVFYKAEVLDAVHEVSELALKEIAEAAQAEAQDSIRRNDQVDAGFLLNSIYALWPGGDSYNQTWPSGTYRGKKSGREQRRERAPQVSLPANVVVGLASAAVYAIYVETRQSFLYTAVLQMRSQVDRIVSQVGRQVIGR